MDGKWAIISFLIVLIAVVIAVVDVNYGIVFSPSSESLDAADTIEGCPPNSDCCKCCLVAVHGFSAFCLHSCIPPFEQCGAYAENSRWWATCTPDNTNEDQCGYTYIP